MAWKRARAWLTQLEEASKGFLSLTKSDLVNFLIGEHKLELTSKEIEVLRVAHYDPVRFLNWVAPRLKEALENQDHETVATLQSQIRGIELPRAGRTKGASYIRSHDVKSEKPKARKNKKQDIANPTESLAIEDLQQNLVEG